jgi:hypothetical protein
MYSKCVFQSRSKCLLNSVCLGLGHSDLNKIDIISAQDLHSIEKRQITNT